jgi:hypothetical protein
MGDVCRVKPAGIQSPSRIASFQNRAGFSSGPVFFFHGLRKFIWLVAQKSVKSAGT